MFKCFARIWYSNDTHFVGTCLGVGVAVNCHDLRKSHELVHIESLNAANLDEFSTEQILNYLFEKMNDTEGPCPNRRSMAVGDAVEIVGVWDDPNQPAKMLAVWEVLDQGWACISKE